MVLRDITLPGTSGIEATRGYFAREPAAVAVLRSTDALDDLPGGRRAVRGCGVHRQGGPHTAKTPLRALRSVEQAG